MKLNYHDFKSGESNTGEIYNGKFKVRVSVSEYTEYDSEPILTKFKENHHLKMELYIELMKQEKEITKRRKTLLKELKEEFSIFAKEEAPEMYL